MQKKITPLGVISIIMALILVIGAVMMFSGDPRYSTDEIKALELAAGDDAALVVELEKNLEIASLQAEVTDLTAEVTDLTAEAEEEVAEEEKVSNGFVIDDLFFGGLFAELTLSDREVVSLFDGEVEFDGEDYDAEEVLVLNDLVLEANNEDMEGNVHLTLVDGSLSYLFSFENLDVSEIGGEDEEYLTFNLLGSEVSVSEWDDDSIVFSRGEEFFLEEGESITVGEDLVTLKFVMEDSVYVDVNGEAREIQEDQSKMVNGLEIRANLVLPSVTEARLGLAELLIGVEVEVEADSGDEYADDSPFEWYVDGDSATIGVVLAEDFDELDEDFNALSVEGKLCLPNEYVCLVYNGPVEEDTRDYRFVGDDEETEIYGDFIINDRDSCDDVLIRFNESGNDKYTLWDEDNDYELDEDAEIESDVELEDSEFTLEVDEDTGVITLVHESDSDFDIVVSFNVSSITVDGLSLDKDYDFVSEYGVIVSNTEELDEDLDVTLTVPEEQVEYTATLV